MGQPALTLTPVTLRDHHQPKIQRAVRAHAPIEVDRPHVTVNVVSKRPAPFHARDHRGQATASPGRG